ncbi:MAG: anthranilate synthase component I family protein, partial [Chloroflexi bacterium]|nr:anthranilate synthase component I family protein [Chloroflexota bacterium]
SQRFSAPAPGDPWLLYESLRRHNPAPFSAYLNMGAFAVLSSSPERFLRLRDGVIETSPIKGTRPRGVTEALDDGLALDLKNSVKDRAEHVMIVDLERNDLGRVAETGSVQVTEMMALRRFATVQHLVSTVQARLRPDTGVADLLRATFPGGSITGAPKIRAMEIIDELEPVRRGVYTGAIGYFSAHGGFDLNIAIRTMVVKDSVAHVHVGGGIVYDSDPEAEYQETLDKGRGMLAALGVTV